MRYPKIPVAVLSLFAGVVGLVAGYMLYQTAPGKGAPEPDIPGFLWPQPKALTAFSLADHNGQPFNLDHLKGRWTFLFFGYTYCPDVCPLTLSVLADVEKRLAQASKNLEPTQVAFVSIDPGRDTHERLRQYVQYFSHDFLGVTGEEKQVTGLTRQLGIVHIASKPGPSGDYLVDHTASVLLTDPEARLVAIFGLPHDAETIANRFMAIRGFLAG